MQSFPEWLKRRPDEVPGTTRLAMLIARSGAAGVSQDSLRQVCGLSPGTLRDLLRALVSAGQVRVLKVGGRLAAALATP
jgi:predicted transcriptional regulator